ncbi:hypothetical protein ACFFU8_09200 [Chromobacterium piscinae]|uniref:hypothetical protein n=1 Tax=Chromobacterium piscinae TaxID=686831 RepID=UPI001E2D4EF7|nr:hypothetical protein [Chromobacterium piscinae]MCD5327920.1 hypothetical protein [Chromobacterium piscinae]
MNKISVDDFIKSTPIAGKGRRSRLMPFLEDIKTLREKEYSLSQICAFLQANNVQTTVATVSSFIRRHISKEQEE